jgi:hypothetical protein
MSAGATYTITTSAWGQRADTYLALFDDDGATLLASNDDYAGTEDYSSQIVYQATRDQTVYIQVSNVASLYCCSTDYKLWVERSGNHTPMLYLPIILRAPFEGKSRGLENGLPGVLDGVIEHICPDNYEVDDDWQEAGSILPGQSQVHSFDSNPDFYTADKDVIGFDINNGEMVIFTVDVVTNTLPIMELFDEYGNGLGVTATGTLEWKATHSGRFYLSISPQTPTYGCADTAGYRIRMEMGGPYRFLLPIILREVSH